MDDFRVLIAPFETLPLRPPPIACPRSRIDMPRSGTAPYCRMPPSSSRSAGPKRTEPPTASRMKCRSSGPLAAKCSTAVHSCHPSSEETSSTGAPTPARIGLRSSGNSWPGTPSDSPSGSISMISAWIASTVPPTVQADRLVMIGEDE